MRDGAQSHLLEACDGRFYIVKFQNNPRHRRILVNEPVSSVFLHYLQISGADAVVIEVTDSFLRENPAVTIALGARNIPVAPGWQFGSLYPGNRARVAVYDFVPDAVLDKVRNLEDFLGALVVEKEGFKRPMAVKRFLSGARSRGDTTGCRRPPTHDGAHRDDDHPGFRIPVDRLGPS